MITVALTEFKDHFRTYLNPFPETYPDRTKEMDFHTAIHLFDSHLTCVLFEMEDNKDKSKELGIEYAGNVIKYISEARERVNEYFRQDTPENREYNNRLQQIEAEVISEEPNPPGHNHVDYSPSELALYFNKVCLWHQRLFNSVAQGAPGGEIKLPELETISQIVLLLNETGIYEYIYTSVFPGNKERTAELISAITGRSAGTIKTAIKYLGRPNDAAAANPYTIPAMNRVVLLLDMLKLDSKKLHAILSAKLSGSK